MSAAEVKACPFCQQPAQSNMDCRAISEANRMAWCVNLECAMFERYTELDKWNRRASPICGEGVAWNGPYRSEDYQEDGFGIYDKDNNCLGHEEIARLLNAAAEGGKHG